ncbi:unnamed protein product [Rhizophagus irregularis]|nr:unnamed protein product [Rhizophagus irregularis]CAB4446720.1 unnamed protein product [Rhizophagus irregularis]
MLLKQELLSNIREKITPNAIKKKNAKNRKLNLNQIKYTKNLKKNHEIQEVQERIGLDREGLGIVNENHEGLICVNENQERHQEYKEEGLTINKDNLKNKDIQITEAFNGLKISK